jgi:hypothetical protein
VLRRRSVQPATEVYIGKEANRVEEAEAGLIHKLREVLDAYADLRRGPWERWVRPVLKDIPAWWLEKETGLSRRTIQRLRNGYSRPRAEHEAALSAAAAEFAASAQRDQGIDLPESDIACLHLYLESRPPQESGT